MKRAGPLGAVAALLLALLPAASCGHGARPQSGQPVPKAAPATAGARADTTSPALGRDERWRDDLRFLATELPRLHRNAFAYVRVEVFEDYVKELFAAIPTLTDAQVLWRLQRLAALLRDGHTRVQLGLDYRMLLPVSLYRSEAGLFVVGTTAEQKALLGRRVVALNGQPLQVVEDSIARYLSHENRFGLWNAEIGPLLAPAALRDLGLGHDSLGATLGLEDASGAHSTVSLAAVPAKAYRAAQVIIPPPLYRERANEKYWFTYLPDSRTLYLQYSQCRDEQDFRVLADSVARVLDARPIDRMVVDLRFNGGGNSEVIRPLIEVIRVRPRVNHVGALYVVVGRATFSSGTLGVIALRSSTHATVVGEPNGERPNHYGEVRTFTLPRSGLTVRYSTKHFQVVPGDPDALYPDVTLPLTAELLIAGRDPVMDWILAQPVPVLR